jgi:hypothetical protein
MLEKGFLASACRVRLVFGGRRELIEDSFLLTSIRELGTLVLG